MSETRTSPDAIARSIADDAAGGTLDELRAREDVARRAVDTWITAYMGALANPRNREALDPPYTVKEAAELLRIGESSVRELIRTRQIKAVSGIGAVIRISRDELERRLNPPEDR